MNERDARDASGYSLGGIPTGADVTDIFEIVDDPRMMNLCDMIELQAELDAARHVISEIKKHRSDSFDGLAKLFIKSDGKCYYCHRRMTLRQGCAHSVTRDHVVPRSANGPNVRRNVVGACMRCNCLKSGMLEDEFRHLMEILPRLPEFGSREFRDLQSFVDRMLHARRTGTPPKKRRVRVRARTVRW